MPPNIYAHTIPPFIPLFGAGSLASNSSTTSTGSIGWDDKAAKRRAREQRRAEEQAIIFGILREEVQKALLEIARSPLGAKK